MSYFKLFDLRNRLGSDRNGLREPRLPTNEAEQKQADGTDPRTLFSPPDRRDTLKGGPPRAFLHFAGNDYLNLSTDPRIIEARERAVAKWGTGTSASSVTGGKNALHEEVEHKLAAFLGQEAAFLFPSGFAANNAAVTGLASPRETIFCDKLSHPSMFLPCHFLEADPDAGVTYHEFDQDQMQRIPDLARNAPAGKMILSDGVCSMDGRVADLQSLRSISDDIGALFVVDDTHGVGVLGQAGGGASQMLGVVPDLITGSCAKALASSGGFVAGSRDMLRSLEGTANNAIFGTDQNIASTGALSAAIDIIAAEPERRAVLLENAAYFRKGLGHLCEETTDTMSAIVPLFCRNMEETSFFTKQLHIEGIYVDTIVPPAVPQPRLRFSICYKHTRDDLDRTLDTIAEIRKAFNSC